MSQLFPHLFWWDRTRGSAIRHSDRSLRWCDGSGQELAGWNHL